MIPFQLTVLLTWSEPSLRVLVMPFAVVLCPDDTAATAPLPPLTTHAEPGLLSDTV